MKESHKNLMAQFSDMAEQGSFGDAVKQSKAEYAELPDGMATSIKTFLDFYGGLSTGDLETAQMRDTICKSIISTFRDANRKDPDIAAHFVNGFIQDYPGVSESCMTPRWASLASACLAFREICQTTNKILIWQQAIKLFQSYNEFLNGLFGYLIILCRVSLDKTVNPNVLNTAYGNKIHQLEELSGAETGPLYLLLRIAKPDIRNACAHETIWLDSEQNMVRYTYGNQNKVEAEIDLAEFMVLTSTGTHLAQPYLAAIAFLVVMDAGTTLAHSFMPKDYVQLYRQTGE
tara:strand:- start:125 stop:991 length:867 start_codon:yes stop_codon:yes gene_type:complete